MWLLWFRKKKPSWLKKKGLTREFQSHSLSHAVRVLYLFNCLIGFYPRAWKTSREAAALDVFTARGSWEDINLLFSFFLFGCKSQQYHAEGFTPLPALFLSAPRCMSSAAFPFGDETSSHFSHSAPGAVFPLLYFEHDFDLRSLCFLILKKKLKKDYVVFFIQGTRLAVGYLA